MRPQKNAHVNAGGFFGEPSAPGASAPGRLFFGDNERAVRLTQLTQFQRDAIGGIHFEKMMDAFRERRAGRPRRKRFGTKMSGTRSM